jgi:hypothetical protein
MTAQWTPEEEYAVGIRYCSKLITGTMYPVCIDPRLFYLVVRQAILMIIFRVLLLPQYSFLLFLQYLIRDRFLCV